MYVLVVAVVDESSPSEHPVGAVSVPPVQVTKRTWYASTDPPPRFVGGVHEAVTELFVVLVMLTDGALAFAAAAIDAVAVAASPRTPLPSIACTEAT